MVCHVHIVAGSTLAASQKRVCEQKISRFDKENKNHPQGTRVYCGEDRSAKKHNSKITSGGQTRATVDIFSDIAWAMIVALDSTFAIWTIPEQRQLPMP